MCRDEANRLSEAFVREGSPSVRLIAVLHEAEDEEVEGFAKWWPHELLLDSEMQLYSLLFGRELCRSTVAGFLLQLANPWSALNQNMDRGKTGKIGDDWNLNGDGMVHGGLMVVAPHGSGLVYKFSEETLGDAAPIEKVLTAAAEAVPIEKVLAAATGA